MGSLTNFLANRKTTGLHLDQLNLFEGRPVPTGLALPVPVDQLDEDPDNQRKEFPPEAIEELAQGIAQRGILQPIVVSDRNDKGRYLIRFGSRRWRAAIQAGLTTVPVIFAVEARNAYDQVAENLKRQNLSPLELAHFLRRRVDAGESNAEVGRQLGMDLSTVAHHLALLSLPAGHKYEVQRPLKRETQLAIWICLGTLCRIGELLMTRWEDVDLVERYWTIPVANVKGPMGKKQGHRVYLSDFSLRQSQTLKALTGTSPFCFPARNIKEDTHVCVKTVSKQVGDRQIQFKTRKHLSRRANDNALVLKSGSHREWTPHDMRRTGATMMQALGILPDIIDRCQNHVMAGSRVRRHYLHHEFAAEKKAAWEKLGQRIDAILGKDNPSPALPA